MALSLREIMWPELATWAMQNFIYVLEMHVTVFLLLNSAQTTSVTISLTPTRCPVIQFSSHIKNQSHTLRVLSHKTDALHCCLSQIYFGHFWPTSLLECSHNLLFSSCHLLQWLIAFWETLSTVFRYKGNFKLFPGNSQGCCALYQETEPKAKYENERSTRSCIA